jgi:hypothetical protein
LVIRILESGTPYLERFASDSFALLDSFASRADELLSERNQRQPRAQSFDDSAAQ